MKSIRWLVIALLAAVVATLPLQGKVAHATPVIEVSQPTQVTSDTHYERGNSVLKDSGGNYWLFYGRSEDFTGNYGTGNPDNHHYVIYYKKAGTIAGLASATPQPVGEMPTTPDKIYQGQTSSVEYDGKIWVFGVDMGDGGQVKAWTTSDGGSNWSVADVLPSGTDPFEGTHLWATVFDSKIFLAVNRGGDIDLTTYTTAGGWTAETEIVDHEGMPRLYDDSGTLYFYYTSWGLPAYYIYEYGAGPTWTLRATITGTLDDDCDPMLTKVGSDYVFVFAPWDGTKQFLRQWTSPTIAGFDGKDQATARMVTRGGYGGTTWWVDMWPATLTDGADVYMFYGSEANGTTSGTGNIFMLGVDWSLDNDHYLYIQNAIDEATSTTINVVAGTYDETLRLDGTKASSISVIGEDKTTTFITGGVRFESSYAGLAVENFTITGDGRQRPGLAEATVGASSSASVVTDARFSNNILDGEGITGVGGGRFGVYLSSISGSFTFENNEVKNYPGWGTLELNQAYQTVTSYAFSGNYIHDNSGSSALRGNAVDRTDTVTVAGNVFDNNGGGDSWASIEVNEAETVTVSNNSITNTQAGSWGEGQALQVWHITSLTVADNVIEDNYEGIYFPGDAWSSDLSGVEIRHNSIAGNIQFGLKAEPGNTGTGDATKNWWGHATGPDHSSNPHGTGQGGDVASDGFTLTPWYATGTTTPSTENVSVQHNPVIAYSDTIQGGIAAAVSGDTVNVAAGTYTETGQIVIGKDLSLIGAGASTTIIKPSDDTGTSGDARGWFLVNDGFTFNLSNVTLDGTGRKVYQAIRSRGEGSISDCVFTNIKFDESGPDYAGLAIAAFGAPDMNVDVTNCTFSEIGRVGVLYYGAGITDSTFSGNTYTGKGAGDWLDYAVEVGGGATATITRNTISGNVGVANVDDSTSAGILVTTYYSAGSTATITENFVSDSTEGIAVGYDDADTSTVTAFNNSLTGNTKGVGSTAPLVDASANWWGSNTPAGVAGQVSDDVDYTPWLDDGTDTEPGTPGFQGSFSTLDVDDDSPQTGTSGRIQEGIDLVSGSTVNVAPGTYYERLRIDKSVDLRGAQYGVDPTQPGARTSPASESTIDLTGLPLQNPNVLVEIADGTSDVSVAGFTLTGSPTFHYADEAIIRAWDNDIAIEDNILNGYIGVLYKGPGQNLDVLRNRMTSNKNGVIVQPNPANNVNVSDNILTLGSSPAGDESAIYMTGVSQASVTGNSATGFVNGKGLAGSNLNQLTVSGNTFSGNKDAVSIWGNSTFITISSNDLTNSLRYGVNIKGQDISITGNQITGNGDVGVNVDRHVIDTRRVTVSNNDVSGNANFGIKATAAVSETVNAENNYWGTLSWYGYDAVSGIKDRVSGDVDWEPWKDSSLTTSYSKPATTYVDDDNAGKSEGQPGSSGGIFGHDAFAAIQDGINNVATSTVNVADGTYTATSLASIVITKDGLSLIGQSRDGTIIDAGAWGTSSAGWPKGIHAYANDVTIRNFTVQGFTGDTATTGGYGILFRDYAHDMPDEGYIFYSGGIVENVKLQNNYSPMYALVHRNLTVRDSLIQNNLSDGMFIARESDNAIITDNTVLNSGDHGIWVGYDWTTLGPSDNATITGNVVDGAREGGISFVGSDTALISENGVSHVKGEEPEGTGGWSRGAISLKDGVSNVTVSNNVIHDNDGLGTGSGRGIGVDETSSNITITGNVIRDNTGGGIKVMGSTSGWIASYNSVYGNTGYGAQNTTGGLLDFTRNWWGACDGPSGVGPGSGDAVSDYVDYDPWLSGACDYDGDGLTDDAERLIHGTDWQNPDTDGDGCNDGEELLLPDPALGGLRDPLDPWDFYDVPAPTLGSGGTMADRDKAVTLFDDVLAVLEYTGTIDDAGPNGAGRDYDDDIDGDGIDDGIAYDRSVGATWSGPPDGAVTLFVDVLLVLAQSGHNCQAEP